MATALAACCDPTWPCADCWTRTPFFEPSLRRVSVFSVPGMTTDYVETQPGVYRRRVFIGGVQLQEINDGKQVQRSDRN